VGMIGARKAVKEKEGDMWLKTGEMALGKVL
jgi:hypothetical protein